MLHRRLADWFVGTQWTRGSRDTNPTRERGLFMASLARRVGVLSSAVRARPRKLRRDDVRAALLGEVQALEARCLLSIVAAPAGLVSWYRGEGNANDSADGNNGTLQNGATFASGEVGQAFSFDGVDDYVSIPDAPDLHFGNQVTVDGWFNPTAAPGYGSGVIKLGAFHLHP